MEEQMQIVHGQMYVATICRLYGDKYDDRKEDSRIGGLNWEPGIKACHKSIAAFQKELEEIHGDVYVKLSRLRKLWRKAE